jgi:glycosyltransferase involved in cell wall biosynthesis
VRPLKILTWHVHGNYLWYLSHIPHILYLPVKPGWPEGYGGRTGSFPWPDTVFEVPAEEVGDLEVDCVIYQSRRNWLVDQQEILNERQRHGPRIFLEHDPPRESPTETRHPVDDQDVLLVHVTPFNKLMWDSGITPARVIEHGVTTPDTRWTGEYDRGIVVVNGLAQRGRRLGADVFDQVRRRVPLDLVGIGSQECGGVGEIPPLQLAAFEVPYRFFFNPIRYTSLGLAVCEAMTIGLPIIGLATTEMVTVVENGVSGWLSTDVDALVGHMQRLLEDRHEAMRLSEGARRTARRRFNIDRFVDDWCDALEAVVGGQTEAAA